jgi:hypothetical protein
MIPQKQFDEPYTKINDKGQITYIRQNDVWQSYNYEDNGNLKSIKDSNSGYSRFVNDRIVFHENKHFKGKA